MDWRAIAFDWNRTRAFLATVEEGSLSAAARALGVTQPTLGRQVAALEEEFGVVLFERAGRGLMPTPGALALVEHARAMAEAAGRVSLAAGGHARSVAGLVRITASEIHSARLLPPMIARLRREAPLVEVEIVATNETADLRRRQADIAVRSYRPREPDLIARKVGEEAARLYAADGYLARIGRPRTAADLARADFIGFDDSDVMIRGLNELGLSLTRRNFPIVAASHLVHWELVRQGVGIGVFPESLGDAEPGVTEVLPGLPPLKFPIWLTAHREIAASRRIRLVFDLLADELSARRGPRREARGAR